MLRNLALHHDESREKNAWAIEALNWAFRVSTAVLAVEVVAWLQAIS